MSLKRDVQQLLGIFTLIVILLIFGVWFLLLGEYVLSAMFYGTLFLLFLFMIMKGRSMKEKYSEEF